jgi:hypothetical protein
MSVKRKKKVQLKDAKQVIGAARHIRSASSSAAAAEAAAKVDQPVIVHHEDELELPKINQERRRSSLLPLPSNGDRPRSRSNSRDVDIFSGTYIFERYDY